MSVAGDAIVSRVETEPAVKRNVCFYPGMSGPFAPKLMVFWTDVSTNVSGGYADDAEHDQEYVCKILADTSF